MHRPWPLQYFSPHWHMLSMKLFAIGPTSFSTYCRARQRWHLETHAGCFVNLQLSSSDSVKRTSLTRQSNKLIWSQACGAWSTMCVWSQGDDLCVIGKFSLISIPVRMFHSSVLYYYPRWPLLEHPGCRAQGDQTGDLEVWAEWSHCGSLGHRQTNNTSVQFVHKTIQLTCYMKCIHCGTSLVQTCTLGPIKCVLL